MQILNYKLFTCVVVSGAEDVAPLRLFYTPETLASYDDTVS